MNCVIDWDRPDYQDKYDEHRCEDCGMTCDTRFCPSCLDQAAYEEAG
jgi:rubrerythrin